MARIMNHLPGSAPRAERLLQHKRKTSVGEGRHVHWASVAAVEFLQGSHDEEDYNAEEAQR